MARGLAREGVDVAICGRDGARAERVAGELRAEFGVRAVGLPADVGTASGVDSFVEGVERALGGVDILVNDAGTGSEETILEAPDDRWQRYWDLHVMAAVRLARALAPSMKRRGGGVILHNASICATQPLGYERSTT